MPSSASPYRLAPALVVALVLLLGAGGPALVHLCAMDGAPAAMETRADAAEMPPCHDGMDMSSEAPAHDETPEPCGSAAQACCLSVAAVATDHAVVAEAKSIAAPSPALVMTLAPETATPHRVPEPRDTGPPPVRSHLALSVLLI